MDEKIANTIALKQGIINEVKTIKKLVDETIDSNVKFTIITKHFIRIRT